MDDFNFDNEIIEIGSDDEEKQEVENLEEENNTNEEKLEEVEEKPTKKKKPKKSLKEKWQGLSKKKKITIIVVSILVILLIAGIIVYFVFFNKKDEEEKPKEKPVILENDNYRYENGKLVFLDKSGRDLGNYECKNKDVKTCYVAKSDYTNDKFERVMNVDENDQEIEKNSQIYNDNIVFVLDGEDIYLYNIADKENLLTVKKIKTYATKNNLVVIEDESKKYGLIEIKNDNFEYLIRPSYDNLGIVNTTLNYLVAEDKSDTYIVDSNGKKISSRINGDIQSVNTDFIVAKTGNSYNLYSYQYEELRSGYDYIGLHDGVISLVKSSKLYLVDYDMNKLYEDGIKLTSNDYVKKYVYKDKKLLETKEAYQVEVKNNTANLTIDKNTKEINILEGKVNEKYSYMNYFDGKLYFYSDVEKENILGTYNCVNKNSIVSATSSLTNCSIYTNNDKVSGIYNNQYVFINDNANNEPKYYLYDLKEKKSKGTYSSIEFLNDSELNNEIKQLYTSSSFIIAKSASGDNKGNYGVLEINSNKVAGKVEFKYKSITKENNYYTLVNIDDSYSIYDTNFKKISNEFSYIKCFDNYYVGINNKKLNVYSYNNALGILEKDLDANSNDFKIDFTDGFNITIDGQTYSYDLEGHVKDGE